MSRHNKNELEPDEFTLSSKNVHLYDDSDLFLDDIGDIADILGTKKRKKMDKPCADVFDLQSFNQEKKNEDEKKMQTIPVKLPEKKELFSWPLGDGVKRDAFGFISRAEPLQPIDNSKTKKDTGKDQKDDNNSSKDDNVDLRDVLLSKRKSDKKDEAKSKKSGDGDESRKRERSREQGRERERSPHGYRRRYSRSPSPRRGRYRRSRTRSRSPRDPRLRRSPRHGRSSGERDRDYDRDRYRYRRYSTERSPDKESESEKRDSSPRRDGSRTPPPDWMQRGRHPLDPRKPHNPVNARPEYNVQMPRPGFHPTAGGAAPSQPNSQGGPPPPGTEQTNDFSRFPPPSQAPPQYNYVPPQGAPTAATYPGYEVYYPGYLQPQHPQPEYIPTPTNNWQQHDMSQPPPKVPPPARPPPEDSAKKEAIEKELLQQKITLSKQREEYLRKGVILNHELELLKAQKKDMVTDKTRDGEKILKENHKLQMEIASKIKAVDNVIDMLTGIIGDERPALPTLEEKKAEEVNNATSQEASKEKNSRSIAKEKSVEKMKSERNKDQSVTPKSSENSSGSDSDAAPRKKVKKSKKKKKRKAEAFDENLAPPGTEMSMTISESRKEESKPLFNYVYYDPEMHWCRVCDEFPRTAKEYLNHLHSKEHRQLTQEKKLNDMPWHDLNQHEEVPFYDGAPMKRTPIKGLQFFVSATAWFCKLCQVWIGDLHCASLHLKSKDHSTNYANFNEQNPHWETDWMADREKAYEKCAEQRRKQRDEELLQKQQQEQLELLKKQEEELKQKFFPALVKPEPEPELVMPLTLPRSFEGPALPPKENEVKKEKEQKKKKKKEKKKKEKKSKEKKKKAKEKKAKKSSSSDSSSTSDTSSESSDSDEEGKYRRELLVDFEGRTKSIRVAMRNKGKPVEEIRVSPPLHVPIPEKSKWELEEVSEPKLVKPPEPKPVEEVKERKPEKPDTDDKMLKEWMRNEISEPEKELAKNLKEKMRTKDKQKDKEPHHEKEERKWDWNKNSDEGRDGRFDKRRNYRDKRQESSRKDKDRDRRKDYRGRHRRSRSRSHSRSRSRDRDREKVTPGVIPAPLYDLFKLPEKHMVLLPESNKDRFHELPPETDDGESKFEKQAVEAAKKKKVQPVINLPKSKFGFIGRMPFAKKRQEPDKQKKDENQMSIDMEAPPPPRITNPEPQSPIMNVKPVLTNKTKVETAKEIVSKYQKVLKEKQEDMQPIDPVDMELEPRNPPLPPSPPVLTMMPPSPPKILESPKSPKKTKKAAILPKDFQDALSIIYPEERPRDETEEMSSEHAAMYQMGYAMMGYPGMHMMQAVGIPPGPPMGPPPPHIVNASAQMQMYHTSAAPPPPEPDDEPMTDSPSPVPPPPPENLFESSFGLGSSCGGGIPGLDDDNMETSSRVSDDDMALLGIDAGDMAAQQL